MTTTPKRHMEPRPFAKVSDLMARYGSSRQTIIRLIEDGKLAAFRVGAQWRVWMSEVEKFEKARGAR